MRTTMTHYEPQFYMLKPGECSESKQARAMCRINRWGMAFVGLSGPLFGRHARSQQVPTWAKVQAYWSAVAASARYEFATAPRVSLPLPEQRGHERERVIARQLAEVCDD